MKAESPSEVRIKICGITSREDAEMAIAFGVDALGFNLFSGSSRCVSLEAEGRWMRELPPFVTRVAVLVNAPLAEARAVAEHPAIDLVQFHGDEDSRYGAEFAQSGRPFIKALRLRDRSVFEQARQFSTNHLLLDSYKSGAYGGTGRMIDGELAAEFVRKHPELRVILGGGLTPENVAHLIDTVRPFAVDVATGVEIAPGRKGRDLVEAFIGNARAATVRP